jgi:hypothetical protein
VTSPVTPPPATGPNPGPTPGPWGSATTLSTRQITALSVGVAVVLIALKAFALGASGSVSILASLADSSLDLIASLTTFYAVRWAARPEDHTHRHGHGKAEAMAALVQAGLVFASAVFIGWEALQRMFDPRPVSGGPWAVGVVVISILVTAALVWLQTRAVKASGSMAVSADRAHYAADLASSVVVLIGVVSGAFLAAPGQDADGPAEQAQHDGLDQRDRKLGREVWDPLGTRPSQSRDLPNVVPQLAAGGSPSVAVLRLPVAGPRHGLRVENERPRILDGVENVPACPVELVRAVHAKRLVPLDPRSDRVSDGLQLDGILSGVLVADHHPQRTVVSQAVPAQREPLPDPLHVGGIRKSVGLLAIAVVDANVVRRVRKDQPRRAVLVTNGFQPVKNVHV